MRTAEHTGGCQCGAVRYAIKGELPNAYACHCGECKKQSASAFSLSIPISFTRLKVTGVPKMFEVTAFSGALKQCYFCGECGTRLWHLSSASPDSATLKVGTLDHGKDLAPQFHLWTSKKQAGILLDPASAKYETQPDNLLELRERMQR